MTTYNNVLCAFSYAAHRLANTLWSERALRKHCKQFHIIWNDIASNIQSLQVDYERLRVRSPAGIWSGMTGTASEPAS